MAVILAKSIFVHIPKTGGTWVSDALRKCELEVIPQAKFTYHITIQEISRSIKKDKQAFVFIRNPVTWYQSRWSDPHCRWYQYFYVLKKASTEKRPKPNKWTRCTQILYSINGKTIDEFDNFNLWLENLLSKRPTWLIDYYKLFIGDKFNRIKNIGYYENIEEDLIKILSKIGEDFDPNVIRNITPRNMSHQGLKKLRLYTEENLKKVLKHSQSFMEHFGYPTRMDDYKHLIA